MHPRGIFIVSVRGEILERLSSSTASAPCPLLTYANLAQNRAKGKFAPLAERFLFCQPKRSGSLDLCTLRPSSPVLASKRGPKRASGASVCYLRRGFAFQSYCFGMSYSFKPKDLRNELKCRHLRDKTKHSSSEAVLTHLLEKKRGGQELTERHSSPLRPRGTKTFIVLQKTAAVRSVSSDGKVRHKQNRPMGRRRRNPSKGAHFCAEVVHGREREDPPAVHRVDGGPTHTTPPSALAAPSTLLRDTDREQTREARERSKGAVTAERQGSKVCSAATPLSIKTRKRPPSGNVGQKYSSALTFV